MYSWIKVNLIYLKKSTYVCFIACIVFFTVEVYQITGSRIPYKKLGHPSLEALLISSKQFTFQNRNGVIFVQAVSSDKTQHLTDLIKKQKSKNKKNQVWVKFIYIKVDIKYPDIHIKVKIK